MISARLGLDSFFANQMTNLDLEARITYYHQ